MVTFTDEVDKMMTQHFELGSRFAFRRGDDVGGVMGGSNNRRKAVCSGRTQAQ